MKLNKTINAFISLALNCLLLIIPYVLIVNIGAFPTTAKVVIWYGSYAVFVVCMILSWWFNRSRVFFTVLTMALFQLVLADYVPAGMDEYFYNSAVFSLAAIVIPLNILVFSILKERGLISSWGRMRFTFVGIEALLCWWIIWYEDVDLLQLLTAPMFPLQLEPLAVFPHLSLFLFIIALVYLVARQAVTGKNTDSPFMGVTILCFTALLLKEREYALQAFFTMAGLLLLMVVIHASHTMAYKDELTGLPSRRALKEDMLKLGNRYAIAMLDIDHFKKFNDTHGHDVGDEVLRLVASCLKGIGGGGKAFRYGGEEFMVLFPGKSVDDVLPYLEEMREYIANRGFIKRGKDRPAKKPKHAAPKKTDYKKLHITVSMGVAEKNERYRTVEEVAAAADKALYRAKAKGRNCVSK